MNASESLAANPDRKLVGRKKHSKCLTQIQTRKLNQGAITFFFFFFPGRTGVLPPKYKSSLFHVIGPIFLWTTEDVLPLPFPGRLCSEEMSPL